ncbi:MAG: hypothetical protein HDT24_01800 [Ruminococcus sp.]|nr:hypothetical protein [Ruminococcus sp.]
MTYNFDFKPTRRLFINVCTWLEQHIDRYFPTEKPDRNTRVYKSMIGGKNAVVSFSKQGISVESDDDLSEYFNRRSQNNEFEIYDRSAKERLKRAGISLAFYIFDMIAYGFFMGFFAFLFIKVFKSEALFSLPISLLLTVIMIFVIFLLTFKPVYKHTGERIGRTMFIQGGGIFIILHVAFLILKTIAYIIYKAVKESFVIPNFTVEQIERGREFYHDISTLAWATLFLYAISVILPLIIAMAVSSHRLDNIDIAKENFAETDKIETP